MTLLLADLVRTHAAQRPQAPALSCGAVTRTFAELHERSSRAANGLRALGVARGDRVAVLSCVLLSVLGGLEEQLQDASDQEGFLGVGDGQSGQQLGVGRHDVLGPGAGAGRQDGGVAVLAVGDDIDLARGARGHGRTVAPRRADRLRVTAGSMGVGITGPNGGAGRNLR